MTVENLYQIQIADWIERVNQSGLSSKDKEKRILELSHLASFGIALLNDNFISSIDEIQLIDLLVEPDFKISYKGEIVGIELARIVNDKAEVIGAKRRLLRQSAKIFTEKYPNSGILANIDLKDCFDAKLNDTTDVRNEIADFVYNSTLGVLFEIPEYISSIYTMPDSSVNFELSDAYIVGALDVNIINKIIDKKASKIANYKLKSSVDKVWLLLIVSGVSPYSDYTDIDFEAIASNQSFDNIFILNDFKKKVYKI